MSYYQSQGGAYGADPNARYDSGLPKINEKRFGDVMDYSQPRPQSSYDDRSGGYGAQQGEYDARNYPQGSAGAGRNQYDQGNGYGSFANNPTAHGGKGFTSTGATDASGTGSFNVQEGQPIQLVVADPRTGQFILNEEVAAELIAAYEGNVSFVSVAGKFGTGKSFLLNRVLNLKAEGFSVDPNVEANTQGIWIWSKPVYNDRDNLYIFFLDTEGSNSVDKSVGHDAKIFALSVLMSSYLIYNSTGGINENSINDLSLTLQLPRNIQISPEESSEHGLSFYTPKLLWALRDFTLDIQDQKGRPITANQYLESALNDQNAYAKSSDTNKKIRQSLINYFKDRECIALPKGSNDDRRMNALPDNQLKPEFLKQISALRDKIVTKASAKQIRGVNLNMRMYISLLSKYLEAFNQGSVPNIAVACDYMFEVESREAYEQAVDLFEIALKQFFFNEEKAKSIDDLYNILKNIRDSTLEKFNKITAPIERYQIVQDFKNDLKDYIDKKEQQVVMINEELNQQNNEELLQQLTEELKNNVHSGVYGPKNINNFNDDFDQVLHAYDAQGQGFSKATGLVNFLSTFQPELVSTLMLSVNQSLQGNQQGFDSDKQRYLENEKNLKKNLDTLREKEKAAADELARVKAEKAELANKTTRLTDQMSKMQQEEQTKIEEERKKAAVGVTKLKEKEKEFEALSKSHKELLEQMKKKQGACCNTF